MAVKAMGRDRMAANPPGKAPGTTGVARALPSVLVSEAALRPGALKTAFAPLAGPDLRLIDNAALLGREGEDGPVLAVVSAPVHFVAARLGEAMAPDAALAAWADAMAVVLALRKPAGRQLVLIDDRALAAPDDALRAAVEAELGVGVDLPALRPGGKANEPLSALAHALLTSRPELQEILALWQGDVLGAEGIGLGFDVALSATRLWQGLQAGEGVAVVLRAREAAAEAEEETARLREDLARTQEEVARVRAEVAGPYEEALARAQDELALLREKFDQSHAAMAERAGEELGLLREIESQRAAEIETATRRVAELEAEVAREAAAVAEMAVLRASIEALERRLADARALRLSHEAAMGRQILADGAALAEAEEVAHRLDADVNALRAELDAMQGELAAARDEVERIFASTSWRMTAPVRATRRLLRF